MERSRGWIIKQALSAWVAQEEERDRLTREALADVDAGQVISQQAVQAWAPCRRRADGGAVDLPGAVRPGAAI